MHKDMLGRRVAVVGIGVSNLALIRHLLQRGASVTACDQAGPEALGSRYEELQRLPLTLCLGPTYLEHLSTFDEVYLTPGMPKHLPEIEAARRKGVPIGSEMGVFFSRCKAPIVGITGSSGKTTTTTLVAEILKASGRHVYVGGNIGRPLVEYVDEIPPSAIVVVELSSFQLELLHASPQVAAITNVTPNHLDIHPSLEDYIAAKERIYRHQTSADICILNLDNAVTRSMATKVPGRLWTFSRTEPVQPGAYVHNGRFVVASSDRGVKEPEEVCRLSELRLRGSHNVENVLAAIAITAACGAPISAMRDVITSFTGVPHRLEFVAQINGVQYYNDSIATSPARAAAGIRAFDRPVVLIAGGYDKHLPFTELVEAVAERVKGVVTVGDTADQIEAAIQTHPGARSVVVRHAESFDQTVSLASEIAEPGDVVLFSPACASYDMFRNFEQRGERFRELVHRLTETAPAHNC